VDCKKVFVFSLLAIYRQLKDTDVVRDKMLSVEEKALLLAIFRDVEVPHLDLLAEQIDINRVLREKEKAYLVECTKLQKQRIVRDYFLGHFHKASNTRWTGEIIILPPAPEYLANGIVRGW